MADVNRYTTAEDLVLDMDSGRLDAVCHDNRIDRGVRGPDLLFGPVLGR